MSKRQKEEKELTEKNEQIKIEAYRQKLLPKLPQNFDTILTDDKTIAFLIKVTTNDINDIPYITLDDLLTKKIEQPARIRRIYHALSPLLTFQFHDNNIVNDSIISFDDTPIDSTLHVNDTPMIDTTLPINEPSENDNERREFEIKMQNYITTGDEKEFIQEATNNKLFSTTVSSGLDSYLNLSCSYGRLECVKHLLSIKVDVNFISLGCSPLDCIIRSCNSAICNKGSSHNVKDISITHIAKCNHVEIARLLVEHGAKPYKMKKSYINNTALMFIFEPNGNSLVKFMQSTNVKK
jgi:hypothetical protein